MGRLPWLALFFLRAFFFRDFLAIRRSPRVLTIDAARLAGSLSG